jgi:hypothetical protein
MFLKKLTAKAPSRGFITMAVNDHEDEITTQSIPGTVFVTEKNKMIIAVHTGGDGPFYLRLKRKDVVDMARFFAEAASRLED